METYSREYLQNYNKTNKYFTFINRHKTEILIAAATGKSRYVIYNHMLGGYEINTDFLIQLLKERFPGVTVEYKESISLSGKTESGIVLDWS